MKMLLKAGWVASMAAKSPLLTGGVLVDAGGPSSNCSSETASGIWFAARSIIKLKCFEKSAPRMAKLTLANRKVHTKRWPESSTYIFSPQQGIASPLELLSDGPELESHDW